MATQSDTNRKEALAASPSGSGTATGQAKDNTEEERLAGTEDRPAPDGAPKRGDFASVEVEQPSGGQADAAVFTAGGTVPSQMVSTPGGFVPVSAVADPEEATRRTLESGRRIKDRHLTEEELEEMDGPSVRAIGVQRGYGMSEMAGSATMRRAFLLAQEKDERFADSKEKKGILAKALGK